MPTHNSNKKLYNPSLSCAEEFFIPHEDSNHLNAQDVVYSMLRSSKSISIATWNCFENDKGRMVLCTSGDLVAELLFEIQTKLEMIERILPLAFNNQGDNHE
ncbi:hypothetical protein [Acinetobacter bereziniae]|uniref:hypothetical protein n=1 Tax=Acinetobacter bereziniae TaxID=106648 RepID=UPI00124F544B|nr:hypothetical protein [Acinetobacter bereziniae]